MCIKPKPISPIPEDTRILAEQVLPTNDRLLVIGQEYADVVKDDEFAALYSSLGRPALSPAFLCMVTLLQALEHCSDRWAVRMTQTRIDWKYALHLPLSYAGFDPSVLCEFRARLVKHSQERLVFDRLLERFKNAGLLNGMQMQRTDSAAVLSHVRALTRLELVTETLRLALDALVAKDPVRTDSSGRCVVTEICQTY